MSSEVTIIVDSKEQSPDIPETQFDKCPKCGGPLEEGFGLAGGGYGPYQYCPSETCHKVVSKVQVE